MRMGRRLRRLKVQRRDGPAMAVVAAGGALKDHQNAAAGLAKAEKRARKQRLSIKDARRIRKIRNSARDALDICGIMLHKTGLEF